MAVVEFVVSKPEERERPSDETAADTVVRAASTRVFLATGFVAVLGLARDAILARTFGATHAMDTLVIVLGAVIAVGQPLSSATQLLMTPLLQHLRVLTSFSRLVREAFTVVAPLVWLSLLGGSGVFVLGFFRASWLVPGALEYGQSSTIREVVTSLALFPAAMVLGSMLGLLARANGRHGAVTLTAGVRSVGAVLLIVLLAHVLGVASASAGLMAGIIVELAILAMLLRRRTMATRSSPNTPGATFDSGGGARSVQRASIRSSIIVPLLPPVSLLIDKWIASAYESGGAAVLEFAYKVMAMPHTLLAMSIVTVTFIELSRQRVGVGVRSQREVFSDGWNLLVLSMGVATACLAIGARSVVHVLYGGGVLSMSQLAAIEHCVMWYSVGLLPMGVGALLARVCFLEGKGQHATAGTLILLVANLILDLVLVRDYGLVGIALATSIVSVAWVLWLSIVLRRAESTRGAIMPFSRGALVGFGCVVTSIVLAFLGARYRPGVEATIGVHLGFLVAVALLFAVLLGLGAYAGRSSR